MSKPGEKALQAMKELDKSLAVFKKPAVPKTKKEKKIILNEETYLEEMAKIIQRDFFPDLQKLKAQNEYLDALASNDIVKLRQIFSKYNSKSPLIRESSPATFETPLPSASLAPDEPPSVRSTISTSSTKSSKSIASKHSLDTFLFKYTSEDNDSFQEIMEAADKKLRQKFSILYEAEGSTRENLGKSLALPSIESQFDTKEKPKELDMWTYKNKNYIMYIPDGVALTRAEEIEMANKKQEIEHNNTRLKANPFNESESKQAITEAAKSQAKCLPEKIGVDGKLVEASLTPAVRGFSFVKSPSPCPGVTDSPLFTWGEIEGTPFRLDGGDTPLHPASAGPSFRIAETSKRETIALQLAEKAAEQSRSKKAKAIEAARRNIASPVIRNTFDRLASMSPAARRLATNKLGFINTPSPLRTPASTVLKTPRMHSSIGIIGLGEIGLTIANRLKGFNVGEIIYSGRKHKPEADEIGAKFVSQTELLKESDYVFVCVPLNNSTRHMINETTLKLMKPTAVLVNVARGEIVDQDALVAALKNGTIFAAGLDVMYPEPLPANSELLKLPNAVIVPHLGSATQRTRDDMSVIAAHNVLAGIAGTPMLAPYPY